jgi:hypothetical protein
MDYSIDILKARFDLSRAIKSKNIILINWERKNLKTLIELNKETT